MSFSNPATPDVISLRKALRQQGIAARKALAADAHAALSARIEAHLETLLASHSERTVAFCWPYQAEFDARPLVTRLLARGWQACLPVVGETVDAMQFRAWHPATPMQADKHGILTPQTGAWLHPDLILLPFNALDKQGYRLGYGAGYFDRTLAVLHPRPYVIGVGFALVLAETIWPQPHDIPVDCAITEAGLLKPG
jgi:5-formyltetrahydrofolate cyclo-ligase